MARTTFFALAAMLVCLYVKADVTVDGLYYGDEDDYKVLVAEPGRGTLYYQRVENMLYMLVQVDQSVNDNVFGDRALDQEYLASVGWNWHDLWALVASDHLTMNLTCGGQVYDWAQDYVYDADSDCDPHEADWLSTAFGPDGWGTPPPGTVSASSLEWNLNHSPWDITLGDTRTDRRSYKSPDPIVNHPGFDPIAQWDWGNAYEIGIDVGGLCACSPLFATVATAHNSPPKTGDPDVVLSAIVIEPISAVAAAGTGGLVCKDTSLLLDGSSSWGCRAGDIEYRWRLGDTVLCDWSGEPGCEVTPTASAGYTLDVRCASAPTCGSTVDVPVEVVTPPLAVAGPDIEECFPFTARLDASASEALDCPGELLYEWWDAATLTRAAGPDPAWTPPVTGVGVTTYTVRVRCSTWPDCYGQDDVTLSLIECTAAVEFSSLEAILRTSGATRSVLVTWSTLSETGTLLYLVEKADHEAGPFQSIGRPVPARGARYTYAFVDENIDAGVRPWYRITEYTTSGPDSQSKAFQAHAISQPAMGRALSRQRARRTRLP